MRSWSTTPPRTPPPRSLTSTPTLALAPTLTLTPTLTPTLTLTLALALTRCAQTLQGPARLAFVGRRLLGHA